MFNLFGIPLLWAGYVSSLQKKIVDKNTIPYHPTKITSDDDLPTTEDDSLEQYLLADYLINQHNESHSNDESDKNI